MNCCVPGCKSRNVQAHLFPHNAAIGEKWVKVINSPDLAKYSYAEIRRKQCRVCYLHFPEGSWIPTFKKPRLRDNAIPTLKLPNTPVLRCVAAPTDVSQKEVENPFVLDVLPSDLSPAVKCTRSTCSQELRKSSLATPPGPSHGNRVFQNSPKISLDQQQNLNANMSAVNTSLEEKSDKKQADGSSNYLKDAFLLRKRFLLRQNAAVEKETKKVPNESCPTTSCIEESVLSSAETADGNITKLPSERTSNVEPALLKESDCEPAILKERKCRRLHTRDVEPALIQERKRRRLEGGADEPDLLQDRMRRWLLAKTTEVVDLSPKAWKIFDELLRVRQALYKCNGQLKRYKAENDNLKNENNLLRCQINLRQRTHNFDSCVLSSVSTKSDL